jgi:predicted alpha/beta hydrolase family esterase
MKNAIILHGRPSKQQWEDPQFPSTSNYYWIPWLQKQLALAGYDVQTPEVPNAYIPNYAVWRRTFEQYKVNEQSTLIGHSCGAGFLVRWLSENVDAEIDKLLLVAPWVDEAGDPDNEYTKEFMNFEIDKTMKGRIKTIKIISSSNDMATIQRSIKILESKIDGIQTIELVDRGHFYDDSAMTFPELLQEVLAA